MSRNFGNLLVVTLAFFTSFLAQAQEKRLPVFKKIGAGTVTSVRSHADVQMTIATTQALYTHGTRFEYQMVALVRGHFAVGHDANGMKIPYVDLDIVPLAWGVEILDNEAMARLVPIHYQRNARLNQSSNLQISAIGAEYIVDPRGVPDAEDSGAFYRIALDAFTFKMVQHYKEQSTYYGGGLFAVQGEYGHYWGAEDARVRVAIGGNLSPTWGGAKNQGFIFQTDASVYVKTSLDWRKFLEFYFQTGLNSSAEFGAGYRKTEWLSLMGVSYYL